MVNFKEVTMVYTVTFNPSVDYVIEVAEIIKGSVNRAGFEHIFWGGKGVNVSIVLKELGVKSTALGFISGFTGTAIEAGLRAKGIKTDLIELPEGFSRINVKIRSSDDVTEINGCGPDITWTALDKLFEKLDAVQDGDTLVLAGSIPHSMSSNIYEKLLARQEGKKIKIVVDATKDLLLNALKHRPFLVKPNVSELGEMFGTDLKNEDEILRCAEKLKEMGAVNVIVSMGGDGAILLDEHGELHKCKACEGKVMNTVGAGDSMVAGFLAGLEREKGDYEFALRLGTAAGSATACSENLAEAKEIDRMMRQFPW